MLSLFVLYSFFGGQSRADFLSKLSLAYKEARETGYWLRLLRDTGHLPQPEYLSLQADCRELCRILCSIRKNTPVKILNS
jgi:four helix bundle protein